MVPQAADPRSLARSVRIYAETVLMVAAATAAGQFVANRWGAAPVDLLYLVPVLAAASLYGVVPGIVAAIGSALAYNFFFTEPIHTFRIHSPADIVTVIMLFAVALVVSQLAAAMRRQARIANANAARNATVAGFAGRLLSCSTPKQIGGVACGELSSLFGCNAVLAAPGAAGQAQVIAAQPPDAALTPADIAAAALVLASGEKAGRGAPRLDPAEWLFFPVKSEGSVLGAIGLARDDGRPPVPDEHLPLLINLLDQTALALQRSALEREMAGMATLKERDHLRGALLSSVGHDLRTPLTAVRAAAAELRQQDADPLLVATIETEAAKLERYIGNLLDMARVEAGTIAIRDEPVDLVDAVSAAVRDLRPAFDDAEPLIEMADDLPLVRADPQLLHHCLINILDNAARHSPPGGRIRIVGWDERDGVGLSVIDEGPGLPEGEMFEKFSRLSGSDRKGGAGLGLAIVKAFASAMGAGVSAGNNAGGAGATFTVHFPPRLVVSESKLEHAQDPGR